MSEENISLTESDVLNKKINPVIKPEKEIGIDTKDPETDSKKNKFKMGYAAWTIIYNSGALKNKKVLNHVPDIFSNKNYDEISSSNFSWKKILTIMAVDKLLELTEKSPVEE